MESPRASKPNNESGIALMMVLAAVTMLFLMTSEILYVAGVNQRMSFDAVDQVKAHYLAKSAFKLALLRLKGYQQVKALTGDGKNSQIPGLPKKMIDQIWAFPFFYPLPKELPGMSATDKEQLTKFESAANLDGSYTMLIEAESSKYNLNQILPAFAPKPAPTPTPTPGANGGVTAPRVSPTPTPEFNPEQARKNLEEYLGQLLRSKFEEDPEFAREYADFRLQDWTDALVGWMDPTYERRTPVQKDEFSPKRAPLYSVSELHLLPPLDDALYDVFAPNLTTQLTRGMNANRINEAGLKALVPGLTADEVKEFFKYRDSDDEDHLFKSADEFFKYLLSKTQVFKNDEKEMQRFKEDLQKRGIQILIDENVFKVTIQATVNRSVKTLEAMVQLLDQDQKKPASDSTAGASGTTPTPAPDAASTANSNTEEAGLRVTFMRLL